MGLIPEISHYSCYKYCNIQKNPKSQTLLFTRILYKEYLTCTWSLCHNILYNPKEILVHMLLSLKTNIKLEMHVITVFFNNHLLKCQILDFIIESEISSIHYVQKQN